MKDGGAAERQRSFERLAEPQNAEAEEHGRDGVEAVTGSRLFRVSRNTGEAVDPDQRVFDFAG
jgi:hypothetical protein